MLTKSSGKLLLFCEIIYLTFAYVIEVDCISAFVSCMINHVSNLCMIISVDYCQA